MVIGQDPGAPGQDLRRLLAHLLRCPGPEIHIGGCCLAPEPQGSHGGADRRDPADVVLPAKAHAREPGPGVGREQAPLPEPLPEGAAGQDGVWSQVGLVLTGGAAGPATQLVVRLKQGDLCPLLGAGDGGAEAGQAAAHNRDGVHATSFLDRTLSGNWFAVKVQSCVKRMVQLAQLSSFCCPWTAGTGPLCTTSWSWRCERTSVGAVWWPGPSCPPRERWPPS